MIVNVVMVFMLRYVTDEECTMYHVSPCYNWKYPPLGKYVGNMTLI